MSLEPAYGIADSKDRMRIGIVGAGRIGHALAVRFAAAGHEVMLSNSRGPGTLADVVASIEGSVSAGTVAEAARFAEVVAIAIPPRAIRDLPPVPFAGKIVVDANNYYPEFDGQIPELAPNQTTTSEVLASVLPGATVVKAFNTIYFQRLLDESRPDLPADERLAIPVAGDDLNAKQTVIDLIDQAGFTGVDAGTLADSRRQQPGSPVLLAFAESRRHGTTLTAPRLRELLAAAGVASQARRGLGEAGRAQAEDFPMIGTFAGHTPRIWTREQWRPDLSGHRFTRRRRQRWSGSVDRPTRLDE
jgi:8-hydroxy-5-deazaflavin:NADPH oxidoreductase